MAIDRNEIDIKKLEDDFRTYLYRNNGKVTPERMAILRALYTSDGHFSVEDIIRLVSEEEMNVSRATVYRTLDLLVECKLAKKHAFQGQETLYESTKNSGHHDHVVCLDCHRIREFFNPELENLQNQILSELQMEHVSHVHQLYAHCTDKACKYRTVESN